MKRKTGTIVCLILFAATFVLAGTSQAEDYPTHPIQLVVPYSPGGTTDLFYRTIGDSLAKRSFIYNIIRESTRMIVPGPMITVGRIACLICRYGCYYFKWIFNCGIGEVDIYALFGDIKAECVG